MTESPEEKPLSQQDVTDWLQTTDGTFHVRDAMRELDLQKSQEVLLRVALSRLVKKGVLESVGGKMGNYRLVQKEWEDIDIFGESQWYHFDWPFPLRKYVKIGRKGIIVIAGVPGLAKTALCLNFAMMNADKHIIWYYDSESGPDLLKERLLAYDPNLTALPFHLKVLEGYPEDAIRAHPDDVNIIDYVEVPDEAYKVAGILKRISDNLGSGVAIVALQKPPGRDAAFGGIQVLNKPQLYLSLDMNGNGKRTLKIVKAKSRAIPTVDPVDKQWTFNLENAGMKFKDIDPEEWVDMSTGG